MITIDNNGKPIRVSATLPKGSDWKSDLNMPHSNDNAEDVKVDPEKLTAEDFAGFRKVSKKQDELMMEGFMAITERRAKSVDHPEHYNTGGYECIDVMEECFGTEAVKAFCLCNAFKYLWRCKEKHETPIEDIKKAVWYLEKYSELSKYE